MSQSELSPQEISRRITTGMALVYDLFKEMHNLFRLIADGLKNSDADLQPQGPKGFILPRGKKGITVADRFVKHDMGLLVAIGTDVDVPDDEVDDGAGDDDSETEGTGDEESEVEEDAAMIPVTPDTQYLGIRAILFDPQAADPTSFQPVLVAAIINSMTKAPRGGKKKDGGKKPETKFSIRRAAVKSLVKQLPADAKSGQGITARVRGAILNACLGGVRLTPLAEITSEEKVNEFVDGLVKLVEG